MLVAENITKEFPGVKALENVSLELLSGKVNTILGENGAGKSTLMKILSGVYSDYQGRILFKGKPVRFSNPREAQDAGIAIIHQELNLIPYLSITENIFLGREILSRWGTLDKAKMRARTIELLDRLKLSTDPDTAVQDLKVGQQQIVEIAKALLLDSELIIMDEPTSAISESEVEVLFDIILSLKEENKAIVYISHKLDELFRIADRFIVLRDGRFIEAGDMKDIDHDELIRKMVGREIKIIRKQPVKSQSQPVLRLENISLKAASKAHGLLLKDISFQLKRGEIIGIFGLMGAGRTELLETIFGLHAGAASGSIIIEEELVQFKSPADAIRSGLALVPEDRKKDGLVLGMDIKENISLPILAGMEKLGFLSRQKERSLAAGFIDQLRIKTPSQSQVAQNLSGGNQQKVVLAKWLATKPKVLMLDEPTRGIDINAKNEIYKLILKLAEAGLGIIVVSSEMPEILTLADRILVMSEGRLRAEFPADAATEDGILKAAIPKTI